MESVECPYCGRKAEFTTSRKVYKGRDFGMIYLCEPCNAYVGATKDGKPKGNLAKADLRRKRQMAHSAFDRVWTEWSREGLIPNKEKARAKAYHLAAEAMRIPKSECHIAMFREERCNQITVLAKSGKLTELLRQELKGERKPGDPIQLEERLKGKAYSRESGRELEAFLQEIYG